MVSLLSREDRGADVTERPRRVKGDVSSRLAHAHAPPRSQFGDSTATVRRDRAARVVVAPVGPPPRNVEPVLMRAQNAMAGRRSRVAVGHVIPSTSIIE